jgi:hypothetical protein
MTNYISNSSLTSTLSSYVSNSSLTSTLTNYAPINSPDFTGVPSSTTPANGNNNTTRIPTCEWIQSYFGNLESLNTWSNTNNFTSLQLNGIDINDVFNSGKQYSYSQTTNLGADTKLINSSIIVMTDDISSSTMTLTLPNVNNNVGCRIGVLNLSINTLTIQTNSGVFKGRQLGNSSFTINTTSFQQFIGYYAGDIVGGYFWLVL